MKNCVKYIFILFIFVFNFAFASLNNTPIYAHNSHKIEFISAKTNEIINEFSKEKDIISLKNENRNISSLKNKESNFGFGFNNFILNKNFEFNFDFLQDSSFYRVVYSISPNLKHAINTRAP